MEDDKWGVVGGDHGADFGRLAGRMVSVIVPLNICSSYVLSIHEYQLNLFSGRESR